MGSFGHKANFSNLPICEGNRIVVIIGLTPFKRSFGGWAPGPAFTPVSVPIRGVYNGYGGLDDIDMTPGIEVLEKCFGMDIYEIIENVERIQASCDHQIDYKRMQEICVRLTGLNKTFELNYVMEHECIFDYLVSQSNICVADKEFWRLPHKYLLDAGYTGKPEKDSKIVIWTKKGYPTLKEDGYFRLENECGQYGTAVIRTVRKLYQKTGMVMPSEYMGSYYEACFKADIDEYQKKCKATQTVDQYHQIYSFNRAVYENPGLFRHSEGTTYADSLILCSFDRYEHLDEKYMKECCELACLYKSLELLELPWGETLTINEDPKYTVREGFFDMCLNTLKDLKNDMYDEEETDN